MRNLIATPLLILVLTPLTSSAQYHSYHNNCCQPVEIIHSAPIIEKSVLVPEVKDYSNDYGNGPSAFLEQYGKDRAALEAWRDAFDVAGIEPRSSSYSSSYSSNYGDGHGRVSYAEAPQGRTGYAVSEVEVDAFGPTDVREIVAAIAGYSTQANGGANQLMDRAETLAALIAESVSANAEDALRVATINAENRGQQQAAESIIAAILAAKPSQQTSVRSSIRNEIPTLDIAADPVVTESSSGISPLIIASCAKCHSGETPKGDVTLSTMDMTKAIEMVAAGSMPPETNLSTDERRTLISELLKSER